MELTIHYEQHPPGVSFARDVVLEPCPLCKKSAHVTMNRMGATYEHVVKLVKVSRNANPSVTLVKYCQETHAQISARKEAATRNVK